MFIGAQLFLLGLVVYYVRMVERSRICQAVGGTNLGISAFSALVAWLVISGSLPAALSEGVMWLIFGFAVVVAVVFLIAGLLNVTWSSGG